MTAIGVAPDVVIECTGHGPLVFELADVVAPDAVICLTGISSGTRTVTIGLDEVNKEIVLENTVLFGSVNASRRNYEQAATALAEADRGWLERHHPPGPDERVRRRPAQTRRRRQSRCRPASLSARGTAPRHRH